MIWPGNFPLNPSLTVVLRAASLSLANLGEEYVFPDPKETVGVVFPNSSSASISLPQELLVSRGIGQYNIIIHICVCVIYRDGST